MSRSTTLAVFAAFSICLAIVGSARAQTTAFTYQGRLTDNSVAANGTYDMQFKLFDSQTVGSGTQYGSMVAVPNVTVTSGIFTVQIDFGACPLCFNGSSRFLETAVKKSSDPTFVTFGPRQAVNSNPYAIRSLNSTAADGLGSACVNCVTSGQIQSVQGSQVSGTIPVASIPPGSDSYIQNGVGQQSAANFNIAGTGTANIFSATTQYNIGGSRFASTGGNNTFVGIGAGQGNTGFRNSYFGTGVAQVQTSGNFNAYFGAFAGTTQTSGDSNSFFGDGAGYFHQTGSNNAFFGFAAGANNSGGSENAFFGNNAGNRLSSGSQNTAVGSSAGSTGVSNILNSYFGAFAGGSDIPVNLSNGTAIGAHAFVTQSNSLVLGSINGINGATADTNVGIGTTAPAARLDIQVAAGQSLQFRQDSGLVPGIKVNTTGGNAGVMRFRNAIEIWPSDDASRAGKLDVRNAVGSPTITLDGQTGNVSVVASGGTAVSGSNTSGNGVSGSSTGGSGSGVYGVSTTISPGVWGNNSNGFGVFGSSSISAGVKGFSTSGVGVFAQSDSGNIVEGYNSSGRKFHIDNNGTYTAGSDFAEALPASGNRANYEPGDVLVVSNKTPGKVEKTSRPYDSRVAGIYSTRPGMLGADKNGLSRVDTDDVPVAIVGIVPTKVSAINGRIRIGDLLTTSSVPGYAMRCADRVKCIGAVVGKAMEPLATGKGVIKVLVMLR